MGGFSIADITVFWSRVDKRGPDDCWPWVGAKNRKLGYGRFRRRGFVYLASRLAYLFTHGSLEGVTCVCHSCDNPNCCNPAHLFAGSHLDNSNDKRSKGRMPMKLLESQVAYMKLLLANGFRPSECARWYGIHVTYARKIARGVVWGHIAPAPLV